MLKGRGLTVLLACLTLAVLVLSLPGSLSDAFDRRGSTERLQTLFPLWCLGMGQLSYLQKCEVLQEIGFTSADIPQDDALRQMLSYYSVAKVAEALELDGGRGQ
jgi:hypothetical protein